MTLPDNPNNEEVFFIQETIVSETVLSEDGAMALNGAAPTESFVAPSEEQRAAADVNPDPAAQASGEDCSGAGSGAGTAVVEAEAAGQTEEDDDDFEDAPLSRIPSARQEAARQRHNEFDELFAQWRETGDSQLRDRLILSNRNLVSYLARRYIDRGELSEDVMQVGLIGLIYALDHFDPARGVRFATFATPTILGEIRRYFRDKTWGIRVPRRLQEVNQTINARIEELTQEMDRSPTYAEIARALNMPVEDVVEALEMMHIMEPVSIDEAMFNSGDDSAVNISDQIGAPDPDLETWGEWTTLETALEKLPENERRVLRLAYFEQHSQVEIARQLQVSQMFVSRLQRKALAHLRDLMNSVDV